MYKNTKMKCWKKKLAKVAPICVLSTGFLVGIANPAFASEKPMDKVTQNQNVTNKDTNVQKIDATSNFDNLRTDINERVRMAVINNPKKWGLDVNNGSDKKLVDMLRKGFGYQINKNEFPINLKYSGDLPIDAKVTSAGNAEDFIIARNHVVKGAGNQDLNTPEKSIKQTDSFTYANHVGVKLGTQEQAKLDISIPFVVEGGAQVTLSQEFTYDHTSSNTSTKETTVTFPKDTIHCKEGGTTTYEATIGQANIEGIISGEEIDPISSLNFIVDLYTAGYPHKILSISSDNVLYDILKDSKKPIPSYLEVDDTTKTVKFTKGFGEKIPGKGKIGYVVDKIITFTPDDPSQPSVTIPYSNYMKEQQKVDIDKYIDDLIKKKIQSK
ncbi:ETX/MTX2 family pore-forming toxin [Bacillus mycoides]|uniref:ETX/MTX2 family pore-forming toxin n=1 Tax=Bacillus mycoides TaxID=1405 RepID=UPI0021130406|nr:ETX/MTX2 family pore-forming toxin [Bacillus mycoides]MCQ6530706.1 ETX/MTX2 family pore-forming toxin [Bacillus mycoides]